MEKIQNYTITQKIAETRSSFVYRGHKAGAKGTVIIKVMKATYPSASEIARFKQEYELIKSISLENIIKTYELLEHNDSFALVLEDFNGVSIKSILDQKKKFEIKTFLTLSARIAETLGSLHAKDIVHKDIKPHNILINIKTGNIKITDFGISSVITHERDKVYNPEYITGTLSYMSPEQTGRINRTVDYRTDLYSFGVTMYEMTTGTLPFKSLDPMEIIHSHIAVLPLPPAKQDQDIPEIISDIIMKLLSKTPEERYQNGFGVAVDLNECLRQMDENGNIKTFSLAKHDISNRFIIPQKLFGREKEINILLSSFEKVLSTGKGAGIIAISGAPGIGKSALIHEIHKPIVAKKGYFIFGKFEQLQRDKPYSAIIQAFQSLISQILSESEEMISVWKKEIQNALGVNGRVITDVIPDVELIIGKQAKLPVLGPAETRNRFNYVFEKFVNVFTAKGHPVALFLDDIQWADRASLDLMRNTLKNSDIQNLFIIVSYRDNDADERERMQLFLREIEKYGDAIASMTLGPITAKDIQNLIVDFLKCTDERGAELARLVHAKTGGNPFFVIQFLHTLYNEKMIKPDRSLGWRWDIDAINRMQVTDNLVAMIAGKISRLSQKTQEVLKICACIGNRFDLETMAAVRGVSVFQALIDLTEAIHNGLVSQAGSIYVFHHDRIQEAAYSLLNDLEKSELHYRIGTLALENADESNLQDKLFYIVDQLNLGSAMISDRSERSRLARLNLEAGKKAKASAAYAPSYKYLKTGIKFLESNPWEEQYEIALALYSESAEAAYLTGDYGAMNELAGQVLRHARTTLDRMGIYLTKINACNAQEDFKGAIDAALPIAKRLGLNIRQNPNRFRVGIEFIKYHITTLPKGPAKLIKLPKMTNPEKLALTQIISSMANSAFYADANMIALVTLKLMRLFRKYGHPPNAGFTYVCYGIILLVGLLLYKKALEYSKMGVALISGLGAREYECITLYTHNALVRHWVGHVRDSIAPLLEAYKIGMETGDINYAGFSLFFTHAHSLFSNVELAELERAMAASSRIIAGLNQKHISTIHSLVWQKVLILMGECDDARYYGGKVIDAEKSLPMWVSTDNVAALSSYWFGKLMIGIFYGEYRPALEAADHFLIYRESLQSIVISRIVVLLDSIARLFSYPNAPLRVKIKNRFRVMINQIKMKRMAGSAPMNTLYMYHGVKALQAWLVHGNSKRAEKRLQYAISLCKKYDTISIGALFNAIAGEFYLSVGNEGKARECMADACAGYQRWGAKGVMDKLILRYPHIAPHYGPGRILTDTATNSSGTMAANLDLSSVMKASQAISGEIVLERLLDKLMKIVIENAGAQKGFLIFENRGVLLVEAEGTVGSEHITVLKSEPVEGHGGLSESIVNFVARTKRTLILNNAVSEGEFINDPYVVKNRPKSILCSPILNQGKLSAIIYLENNLASGAFTAERLELLNILSSQIAVSIDNARLYDSLEEKVKERTKELKAAKDALWGELELAKKIQTMLLPEKPEMTGYVISAYMMPAREVGGDYYDFIAADGKNWIVIGDVSGHGVTAGLVMMMTQTAIHNTVTQHPDIFPSDLLSVINKTILANVGKMNEDKYMTITALAAHENGRFVFSGLHQDILVYRAETGTVEDVGTNGCWIGIFEDIKSKLTDETLTLYPGDVMMLYTDGITEAWDKNVIGAYKHSEETMFGQERLEDIFCRHGGDSPEEIQTAILKEMENYTTNDDITIVLIKRLD
jgi:predicted ATPase/serine phosphatase RsbU (regulator of sigma subunit)